MIDSYLGNTLLPSLSLKKFHRAQVGTSMFESDIADTLSKIQVKANEFNIKIGSYPKWKPDNVPQANWKLKVVVSIVGHDKEKVEELRKMIKNEIDGFDVDL